MKLFLKCNETTHACDKSQYKEIGFLDSLRMNIHLFLCKCCRDYSKQNSKLTKCIKSADIQTLSRDQKNILKTRIKNELNNTPTS